MSFKKLKIETIVKGEHSKIWDAWTKPEHITKWNFAIEDWCCPNAENDLRPGGQYKARMEAKDGSFGFDFEGLYEEVIPQAKLVLKMPDGRTSSTEFESLDGQTKIVTVFDAEKQNPEEMQMNGWQAILNNFKKYFESL
jgi:uncharacterized protein YndB with AHSA1/START domain